MAVIDFKSEIGVDDLALATGGTGAAETFTRRTSTGGTLTQDKLDASHLKFRTVAGSVNDLVDGGGDLSLTVSNLKVKAGYWYDVTAYGATGDGITDDTTALNAAVTACPAGGVIYLPRGVYLTTGWLIQKNISLIADTPYSFSTVTGTVIRAAGAQEYVLKLNGSLGDGSGSTFVHAFLQNLSIDGNNQAISDAALVMNCCHLSIIENCSITGANGHGVRLRTCWETRFVHPHILNCGSVDTGSAFYIDGPTPFNLAYGTNNLSIYGGIWSTNRGHWLQVSHLANLDAVWIENNKFEWDTGTANAVAASVINLGAASRTMIVKNTFAGFGSSATVSGNYANLIYINGNVANYGTPSIRVWGNQAMAYNPTSGTITGLYLDTNAPTVEESENTFFASNTETCPNVNVSQFPQLINRSWRNQNTSLYPVEPVPDRELPGFFSIHKITRGTYALPFVADANCINNSMTVLQLAAANQSNADIGLVNLGCWVSPNWTTVNEIGNTYLLVKIRMRLDAAGSVTVTVNPSADGAWNPVNATVNSQNWTWYTFLCPMKNITTANHTMTAYLWSINSGGPKLLVDGFVFETI